MKIMKIYPPLLSILSLCIFVFIMLPGCERLSSPKDEISNSFSVNFKSSSYSYPFVIITTIDSNIYVINEDNRTIFINKDSEFIANKLLYYSDHFKSFVFYKGSCVYKEDDIDEAYKIFYKLLTDPCLNCE